MNHCTFVTVGVITINYSNKVDKYYDIKEIGKGSTNKFILYQIDIVRVNGNKRNMIRGSKRRLLCQTGTVSTTVLNTLPIYIPPY